MSNAGIVVRPSHPTTCRIIAVLGNVSAQPDGELFMIERSLIVVAEKKRYQLVQKSELLGVLHGADRNSFAKSAPSVCVFKFVPGFV